MSIHIYVVPLRFTEYLRHYSVGRVISGKSDPSSNIIDDWKTPVAMVDSKLQFVLVNPYQFLCFTMTK